MTRPMVPPAPTIEIALPLAIPPFALFASWRLFPLTARRRQENRTGHKRGHARCLGNRRQLTRTAAGRIAETLSPINEIAVVDIPIAVPVGNEMRTAISWTPVDYMNSAPFPDVTNATGTAIYVLPQFLDASANDLGSSWARSTAGIHGAYQELDGGIAAASPGVVVPEPASLVMGLMVALLGALRRRR